MQRRWTKQIAGLNNVDYAARLNQLKLFSIQGRMFRADLVKLWKAFNAEVDVGLREIFERQVHGATRGHRLKLSVPLCRTDIRRRFLNVRCVNVWNNLPSETVTSDNVVKFKRLLEADLGDMLYGVLE